MLRYDFFIGEKRKLDICVAIGCGVSALTGCVTGMILSGRLLKLGKGFTEKAIIWTVKKVVDITRKGLVPGAGVYLANQCCL